MRSSPRVYAQKNLEQQIMIFRKLKFSILRSFFEFLTFMETILSNLRFWFQRCRLRYGKLPCISSYAQVFLRKISTLVKSMFLFLLQFLKHFDFSKTTQSDTKGLIRATGCEKPSCISCFALKFEHKIYSGKTSTSQKFSHTFNRAATKVLG